MKNLGDLLSASAARNPQQAAIAFEDRSISYEWLEQATTHLAQWFLQQGCKPGDRVAFYWPNSIETAELYFACFKAGLIAVPVNVMMKAHEVAYVLEHSKAVLCFVRPDRAEVVIEAGRNCASLRAIHTAVEGLNTGDLEVQLPEVSLSDPALIMYTSGTTALPKGVTHTHRTLLANVDVLRKCVPDLERFLVMTQIAFASGLYLGLLTVISSGGTCVLAPAFDAPHILDLIERFQCTSTLGLPSMVHLLLEAQTLRPRQVSSIRTFLSGGDSVPVSTHERFQEQFGIALRECFGMTETSVPICNPAGAIRPGSLGKVVDGVQARVVDSNAKEVPDGQTGELIVKSPVNLVGYWDDPAATRAALRDGWLFTGDLVRRDSDGYFWFEGRKKQIIVRDGFNISPQEIEEALYIHPAVLETGVIGMPDPVEARGERVLAFVALRDGCVASENELREHARRRLVDLKVPEEILFLEKLPKGISGKIDRAALKQLQLAPA
ncbi:MAG TPA: AMP-binding protein [Bryobacteraceae bacterium]|nr:AMP-binding protein [Bryobacteraceae bacterium]